jgi:hypothetical protein
MLQVQGETAMNDRYTRITVPLSKDEFEALQTAAQIEYRHPREQARYLLRSLLLGEQTAENKNGDTPTFHGKRVTTSA